MYPQHIQEAAAAIGRTLTESATPLYGSGLRLPDRRAVIELVKEVRRLLFPAYFGDPALMSLAPENYAALLLERICEKLTEQLKLALPEDQVQRAEEITREFVRRLPRVQRLLLEDLDATFESDPAAASREEIIFAYPGLFAIFVYRIAHLLYCQRVPMTPGSWPNMPTAARASTSTPGPPSAPTSSSTTAPALWWARPPSSAGT